MSEIMNAMTEIQDEVPGSRRWLVRAEVTVEVEAESEERALHKARTLLEIVTDDDAILVCDAEALGE